MNQADEDRIAELLLRWEEAFDHGQDLTAEELCVGSPELLEPVKERIAALKKMAWVKEDPTLRQPPELHGTSGLPTFLANRYRIEGLIAEGGHGQVYRAFDEELKRPVAIKVSKRTSCPQDDLLEEARRVARLRHPGIVAVHDVGRHEGTLFVVSDLIEGQNLAEIERPGVPEAVRIVAEVADALHFAHQQGFVHRDIKPGNILLDADGHPFITDFGIATTAEELVDGEATSVGTLPYMAPEQVAGETQLIDRRTDIYALGVVLYELLTGKLPYQARTPLALREQILFRSPAPFDEKIPDKVEAVCLKCLAKHPADRYATADELATDLRKALAVPIKQGWRWLLLLGIVFVLILTGVAIGILWSRNDPPPQSTPVSSLVKDGVLVFDGRTRIVTPLERFAPVTLEAWVCPEPYEKEDFQFLIGSDIPTHHGIGLSICGSIVAAEYISGILYSDKPVMPKQWSHLAAVFGDQETKLYLNGSLISTGPATQVSSGATFVIGNLGKDNPIHFYRGQMRSLRISQGERYTADFEPTQDLPPDDTAVLVYSAQSVDGDVVRDLSGHGNDGEVERLGETKTKTNDTALETDQKVLLANGNEVWVMDATATAIEYSFDQEQWSPVTNPVKTVVLMRGTISDPRISDQRATVYVRYTDRRGNQSHVYEIPVASVAERSPEDELGQPIDASRFIQRTGAGDRQP